MISICYRSRRPQVRQAASRTAKPGPYKRTRPEHWRPAKNPPQRMSKARRLIEIMRELDKRAAEARLMLTPSASLLRELRA